MKAFFKKRAIFFLNTVDERSGRVESTGHEHLERLDQFTFCSYHNWYMFTKSAYCFMIQCLQNQFPNTGESILNVDPSFYVPLEPLEKLHHHVIKNGRI